MDIPYLDRRNQRLFGLIAQDRPETVLEIGCGEGIALHYINPIIYVGIDTSRVRLRFASNLFKVHSFIQGDGTCLPFSSGRFDVVFCNGTLHHLSKNQILPMMEEMKRTCKKGGRVAIMEPNAYNFSSLMLALLRKPERGILHCKSKLFLQYFNELGMGKEIEVKYDDTFAPINLFVQFFKKRDFVRTRWFTGFWESIDDMMKKIFPEMFWANIIVVARK
ncbi:MAG TPA: class I SAM-dependent methyltransferase [Thermodesulfobacteriota bacterium]|nr:class I SAM-dependent methyltransferase [Thermodesulfobacteriota bacterium]